MWGNEQDFRCLWYLLSMMAPPHASGLHSMKAGGVVKLLKCDCEGRDASRLYTWDVNHIGVFFVWQMSHRSYRPVLPTGNKLLQKKWDQTYYDEHRRLVRNCWPNHVTAYSWPYIALFPDPSPSHLIVSSSTKWNIPSPYTISITNPLPYLTVWPTVSITNPPPYLTVWPTVSMFSCTTILIMTMYDTVTVLDCLLNLPNDFQEREG